MTANPEDDILDLDNDYDSADDEDFQLEEDAAGRDDDSGLSSSEGQDEEEQGQRPTKKRKLHNNYASNNTPAKIKKRKGQDDDDDKDLVLDSGDEATIWKAKEKKKKGRKGGKGRPDDDSDDDDEGGEGGFVKTRAMRMKIQEERKPLAKVDGATVDVDALWAKMNSTKKNPGPVSIIATGQADPDASEQKGDSLEQKETTSLSGEAAQQQQSETLPSEEMVKIKRTYKFAGEVITEEKLVPKDSAEAKLFLSQAGKDSDDVDSIKLNIQLRRPLRKISRFDPNPTGMIKKSWEKQPPVTGGNEAAAEGPKLNTVEKSRLDWAEYVDQAGIKDELNVHSKAKEGYLGRMDFLDRVDSHREEERRNIRLRGL